MKNYLLLQFDTKKTDNWQEYEYLYSKQICGFKILYFGLVQSLSSSQVSAKALAPHEGHAARDDPRN